MISSLAILSIIVAVLATGLIALGLIVLVVMRDLAATRERVRVLTSLVTAPGVSELLGKRLPPGLVERFDSASATRPAVPMVAVVALRQGCSACEELLDELSVVVREGRLQRDHLQFVVEAANLTDPLLESARALGEVAVHDEDGSLLASLLITATPTLVVAQSDTWRVLDFKLGGDVLWLEDRLNKPVLRIAPTPARGAVEVVLPAATY